MVKTNWIRSYKKNTKQSKNNQLPNVKQSLQSADAINQSKKNAK